jgi:glycosyltransferase involved in cell wall biosynthesis
MSPTDRCLTSVHVSTQATWHGGEGQAYLLIRGLRERGHRVVVFARRGGQFARRTREEGFEVREFHRRGRGPGSLWQMRRWLKEISPDVIHSHDGHALTASGLAALGLNIPLRVASRRVDFQIRSPAKFNRLADVVIAISTAVADVCRASGIPKERIRIVHSGVDPSRVLAGDRNRGRQSLRVAENERLLLVVANLTDHKGHTYLLQALPRVLQRFPNARLALAGTGELEPSLKAEADQLQVRGHVDFLGYRDDIPDLLHAADLFIMPSYLEGLCTSILDAMFARVPIVTTGAGGIADAIGIGLPQGPVAFTAKPRDPDALADSIISALASPTESEDLVDRAYERAAQFFSDRHMAEGTLAVYAEFLTHNRHRAA